MNFLSRWRFIRVSPYVIILMRVSVQKCDDQIPEIKCGYPIQSQSCVQRDDFWFCWTVRNWRLFLTHPTYWNKSMTSKNAQCSSRSGFWIFKISREVRVLKQSQPALFCSITHVAILFVFTSVMDVRYQTIQSFVTSFGPFRNRSCWPQNIRSSNPCQV